MDLLPDTPYSESWNSIHFVHCFFRKGVGMMTLSKTDGEGKRRDEKVLKSVNIQ